MRKNLFLAIVVCLFSTIYSSAQTPSFTQNDNVVSLGVGFGGVLYSGYGYKGSGYHELPTFTISYERCIIENLFNDQSSLGVGGLVGYTSAKYDYSDYWGWKSTDIMIGARGALHYAFVDKLDTYAGVMVGFNINTWKWHGTYESTSNAGTSGLAYTLFVGARYYFTESIAAFAELGYGYSLANVGLSFKF